MAAPMTTAPDPTPFAPGERLVWEYPEPIDPAPVLPRYPASFKRPARLDMRVRTTLRPVVFEGLVDNTHAHVRFGTDTWAVNVTELRRNPAPDRRQHPPAPVPNWAVIDLAPLRDALRQRHAEAHTATATAAEAAAAADRADEELQAAELALAHFSVHEQADADRTTEALRTGKPIPRPNTTAREAHRDAARRRCTAAKSAAVKLTAELAVARTAVREADAKTAADARAVLSGIAHREGGVLAALEAEAARRRAELLAASEFWPPATPPAALALSLNLTTLLTSPPAEKQLPVGPFARIDVVSKRQQPWVELYGRLTGGDAEADIETPVGVAG